MIKTPIHNWGDHPILVAIAAIAGVASIIATVYTIRGDKKPLISTDPQVEAVSEALDALEAPTMLYSTDLRLVYANEKMAAMYDMKKGDMVGKSPDMLNALIRPYVENYNEFAVEQLERIARGHLGETEGRSKVPMRLSARYLNRKSASNWYFVSNPVYIGKERFTITQLLEGGPPDLDNPCAPKGEKP